MPMPRNAYYLKGYTLIFVAAGLVFLVLLALGVPGIGRSLLKAVPVSTLAVLVLREMSGLPRVALAGALIGSACGDFLLDLPGEDFFVFGLAAFLTGHLFYTGLFFRYASRPDGAGLAVIAGLVVFAGFMMWLFRGIEPGLYPPVVLYIAVIVAMSIGAYLVPAGSRLLFWGALLFILSDVVLAVNKFLVAIPNGRLVNISLYFLAQYLIVVAARSIWGRRAAG
ncbi:lysoplasmalogenase [Desulfatitalea alkaliphila]|uniref:Lysoplasmalogenase n=1 Tax=Desulfatitalea alkaliphila TaxID=2929485 RepID=A0AA41R0U8_9BACT|nr:lysoplasmalogenase [Desulfatitalea alkaliphila]MCJ8499929.1 lysoplasmalogenase [Desulfatitalea alkaliphila]